MEPGKAQQPQAPANAALASCRKKKSEDATFLEDMKDHIDEFVHASMDEHKTCFKKTIQKLGICGLTLKTSNTVGKWEVMLLLQGQAEALVTAENVHVKHLAKVYFHDIPDEIITNMIDEGIVFNVAGGLLLEHPLTLPFVEAVVGATDSVMGLPKALTEKLIRETLSLNP